MLATDRYRGSDGKVTNPEAEATEVFVCSSLLKPGAFARYSNPEVDATGYEDDQGDNLKRQPSYHNVDAHLARRASLLRRPARKRRDSTASRL